MTPACAPRRAAAAIAAMAMVLAQLLAIWHHTTVRHHWCATHQDVCEDEGGAATTPTGATDGDVDVARDAGRAAHEGDHADGCSLAGVSFASTSQVAPRPDAVRHADTLRVDLAAPAAPALSVGLLRLAPKTSPPLA